MSYIQPFLAFENEADTREAVDLYVSLFPNSRIIKEISYRAGEPMPEGSLCAISFSLNGQKMMALPGGPMFTKGMGLSLLVNCGSQEEIDRIYEGLARNGGEANECGWVQDKFGFSWQIDPAELQDYMVDEDEDRAHRALQAVWRMKKLDAAEIKRAFEGGSDTAV